MGANGGMVLAFFGGVWTVLTLASGFDIHGGALALPLLFFALLAGAALYVKRMPGEGTRVSAHAGRVIMWSSAAEGLAIPLAIVGVNVSHRPDLVLPVIAAIVALHFLPMAILIPFPSFYGPFAVLFAAGFAGFWIGGREGSLVTGSVASIVVTISAMLAILRDWQARKWHAIDPAAFLAPARSGSNSGDTE